MVIANISLRAIDRKITTFTTNRDKLAALGHEIAMMIFDHTFATDDCTRALTLAKAMPKSWKAQLTQWFAAFSPILVVETRDSVGLNAKYKAERKVDLAAANKKYWKRDEALATPFYKLNEPDPEIKTFDFAALLAMVQKLGKTIEKRVEEGLVKPDDVASAKALASAVSGFTFNRVSTKPANDIGGGVASPKRSRKPRVIASSAGAGNDVGLAAVA